MPLIIICIFILIASITMTMVGKGGGNFYVVILSIANIPMHEAAATGQFILFVASLAGMLIFQKKKTISWTLVLLIGASTALSAFMGGYFSHCLSGFFLKLIFAVMLIIAGIIMLIPVSDVTSVNKNRNFGTLKIRILDHLYIINLWITVPVAILTGFGSGMVGVSGGSFLVPLMVLACGLPMHVAVGTASTLIAITALMGFTGHAVNGYFNPYQAIPLAAMAVAGGILGGKFALKTKPGHLKHLFAYTNWIAALFMILNAFHTNRIA
ncbi:MAG: sulfite exporter TauE/SafE family protein [Calditrichaceae bacterium]|nr:sulfite exporter TauE/SafE family protein [Calditrichaceae bacterium]